MRFNATTGTRTSHSEKHEEKQTCELPRYRNSRRTPRPHVTTANMPIESCASAGRSPVPPRPLPINSSERQESHRTEPAKTFGSGSTIRDLLSERIRATLIGTIRNICAYASFCGASANVAKYPGGSHRMHIPASSSVSSAFPIKRLGRLPALFREHDSSQRDWQIDPSLLLSASVVTEF
jgi:hypothetical protein